MFPHCLETCCKLVFQLVIYYNLQRYLYSYISIICATYRTINCGIIYFFMRGDAIPKLLPLSLYLSLSIVAKNFDYTRRKILIIISDYVDTRAHTHMRLPEALRCLLTLFSFYLFFFLFFLGFQTHKRALSDQSENC